MPALCGAGTVPFPNAGGLPPSESSWRAQLPASGDTYWVRPFRRFRSTRTAATAATPTTPAASPSTMGSRPYGVGPCAGVCTVTVTVVVTSNWPVPVGTQTKVAELEEAVHPVGRSDHLKVGVPEPPCTTAVNVSPCPSNREDGEAVSITPTDEQGIVKVSLKARLHRSQCPNDRGAKMSLQTMSDADLGARAPSPAS